MLIMVDEAGSRFSADCVLARGIVFRSQFEDIRSATMEAMEEPKRAKATIENFMMNEEKEMC
jgi:hypothetical protein